MEDFCPHSYQQYCIDRIIRDPALGLFLDMGLGKTAITLTAIKQLKYEYWAVRKALVIAPKKVAESTWDKEAAKWSHLSCLRAQLAVRYGGHRRKQQLQESSGKALQGAEAGALSDQPHCGADRHAKSPQPYGPMGAGVSAGLWAAAGPYHHVVPRRILCAGQAQPHDDLLLCTEAGCSG